MAKIDALKAEKQTLAQSVEQGEAKIAALSL
jgi:hypothetical protein